MLNPSDDDVVAALDLINLMHVDGHTARQLFSSHGALHGSERALVGTGQLIAHHAAARVRLNDETVTSASRGGDVLSGYLGTHALDRNRTQAGYREQRHP